MSLRTRCAGGVRYERTDLEIPKSAEEAGALVEEWRGGGGGGGGGRDG